jgi:hypothetical protein
MTKVLLSIHHLRRKAQGVGYFYASPRIIVNVSRWKAAGKKKKSADTSPVGGRLLSCIVVILGAMFLLFMLFKGMLHN